jgi:hypothetical protein
VDPALDELDRVGAGNIIDELTCGFASAPESGDYVQP